MARILIVDDEPHIRTALGHLLKGSGHDCTYAGNAKEAKEALKKSPVDLMLCDIRMPGDSGLELARDVLQEREDIAVIMSTAVDDTDVAQTALELGAYGYLIKPAGRNEIRIAVSNALRRRELELKHRDYQRELEGTVNQRTRELQLSQEETLQRLAKAAEFRDNETAEHVQRMSHYCRLIVERMGMTAEKCDQFRLASVMHDVGKIGISDLILLKPGKLTDEEFDHIKLHAEMGHRILSGSKSPLLELGATMAFSHHEKYDGTGYPRGLAGEAIPIEGRIAAVADVFDALTSVRVYRKAWSVEKATDLLIRDKGSHFDPNIVDLFLESMDEVLKVMEHHADGYGP